MPGKNKLTTMEKKVIELRFGVNDELPRTLLETADECSLSQEKVYGLESSAMRKLPQSGYVQ